MWWPSDETQQDDPAPTSPSASPSPAAEPWPVSQAWQGDTGGRDSLIPNHEVASARLGRFAHPSQCSRSSPLVRVNGFDSDRAGYIVRILFEGIGVDVKALKRVAIGPLTLADEELSEPGTLRILSDEQKDALLGRGREKAPEEPGRKEERPQEVFAVDFQFGEGGQQESSLDLHGHEGGGHAGKHAQTSSAVTVDRMVRIRHASIGGGDGERATAAAG